jgi:hypothetical protein
MRTRYFDACHLDGAGWHENLAGDLGQDKY